MRQDGVERVTLPRSVLASYLTSDAIGVEPGIPIVRRLVVSIEHLDLSPLVGLRLVRSLVRVGLQVGC